MSSGIHELVRLEIDRLRKQGESLKAQARDLLQKADSLESELNQMRGEISTKSVRAEPGLRFKPERGGKAEAIVELLNANPTRVFSPESMHKELQMRVDPSLVSRLKKEGRIAKARTGGYCSVNASETLKDNSQSLMEYTDAVEKTMTQ